MFRLLRLIIWTVVLVGLAYFALVVPLGKRTLAGHLVNLWRSPEGQELREGTREAAKPVVDRMKKGVENLREGASSQPRAPARND